MNIGEIKELARLMKETGLTMLEIKDETNSIHLERNTATAATAVPAAPVVQQIQSNVTAADDALVPEIHEEPGVKVITSPMVGVFYTAPSPTSEPYVAVGDTVHTGDVLCIIEAMKMMNEITADVDGVITDICVANTQLVDYGHPLFRIRVESSEG
jgi:acetyl-CoA carboxylase biotin carboxyl carrier protein